MTVAGRHGLLLRYDRAENNSRVGPFLHDAVSALTSRRNGCTTSSSCKTSSECRSCAGWAAEMRDGQPPEFAADGTCARLVRPPLTNAQIGFSTDDTPVPFILLSNSKASPHTRQPRAHETAHSRHGDAAVRPPQDARRHQSRELPRGRAQIRAPHPPPVCHPRYTPRSTGTSRTPPRTCSGSSACRTAARSTLWSRRTAAWTRRARWLLACRRRAAGRRGGTMG